ncbi:MAG: DUF1993 domain-containing protein [Alphaproteobacteria bacterium]|nr:DUF1993 domain-containing protein [Alphaproteobacteria bacterium]
MSFSIYDATIPPMTRMLHNLGAILDKAQVQAAAKGLSLQDLVEARLAPDMHPFKRQIQIASDAAKGCAARLSGNEAPSFPDTEETFDELRGRIAKTLDYLKSFAPAQFDGAEDRHITIKTPNRTFEMNGRDFATGFALPNFFFHVTTAYGLLRHKGIEIGKADYLGGA